MTKEGVKWLRLSRAKFKYFILLLNNSSNRIIIQRICYLTSTSWLMEKSFISGELFWNRTMVKILYIL